MYHIQKENVPVIRFGIINLHKNHHEDTKIQYEKKHTNFILIIVFIVIFLSNV